MKSSTTLKYIHDKSFTDESLKIKTKRGKIAKSGKIAASEAKNSISEKEVKNEIF